MSELSKEELETLLQVQCEMVGTQLHEIDTAQPEWYLQYSWTKEQENEFKDWAKRWLKKKKRWQSVVVDRFIAYYLLNWGRKYENK